MLALIVLSSKQCVEDDDSQAEVDTQMEEISAVKSAFESDYLKSESLYAFEEKAKQKLRDYSDYLNIANDASLDTTFRLQASSMIPLLFYQNKEPLIANAPGTMVKIDSIYMIEPLSKASESVYSGMLGFSLEILETESEDTIRTGPQHWSVEMIATKTRTSFGKDTLNVWKVFLGKMNAISD